MSIYHINGAELHEAYAVNGNAFASGYSIDGTKNYRKSLRVMQYNVGGWYDGAGTNVPEAYVSTYYALQSSTITDNDPDILFINEYLANFSDTGYSALSFLQQFFPYIKTVTYGTYYGRAVCSKRPLSNYQSHVYAGESYRYYDTMTVTVNGVTLTLCVTHLSPSSTSDRHTETVELVTFLQALQTPFICSGDLNTLKSSTTSAADYVGVIQPLLDAGFHLANMGDLGRFITYKNTELGNGALDNIITSSDIKITNAYVSNEKEYASLPTQIDHMPLVADIEI